MHEPHTERRVALKRPADVAHDPLVFVHMYGFANQQRSPTATALLEGIESEQLAVDEFLNRRLHSPVFGDFDATPAGAASLGAL
jgi:hypothetical protein